MSHKHKKKISRIKALVLVVISLALIAVGVGALWVSSLTMPDLKSFENRKIDQSTKIYDRTGTIILYDTGANTRRTSVPLAQISPLIQKATIAIEDSNFYANYGVEPLALVRAVIADLVSGQYEQGASTITQQVIKNSLLSKDKTFTRKIKEFVLAIKLTKIMSKDQILEAYLNDNPYGGTIYGVEEACRSFFGKSASDVTLAEASYIAAIPQAPTYYSPYGLNRDALDARRKLVLTRMKDLGLISSKDYDSALKEKVQFLSKDDSNIRAPHFVMMIKDYLTKKYGEDMTVNGGLKVITTLDYDMQKKAEEVVDNFAPTLLKNFKASNEGLVAMDPKTGDVLTLVGSKDYFSTEIDGNYNIALAKRQPGSTFKPFVYATAFKKGYTPETILFDTKTEFSTYCSPDGKLKDPSGDPSKACYTPGEYDDIFEGPIPIRTALAQSRNIPAVKALYLAGIKNSIETATDMGISTLTDENRYGLTLVLGGGEVTLLDLVGAYGTFANDGVRNQRRIILKITDSKGTVLEESQTNPVVVLDSSIARQISDILSDTNVRMTSLKPIAESVGRKVAIKTGTTNDYRDVWTVGYTPSLVVGAWAGNNDNTPMEKNVAGLIISPLWGAFMSKVAQNYPPESFGLPPAPLTDNKPVLRGVWQGGQSYWKDSISGKLATALTPNETKQEVIFNNVHTILNWVNKDDPLGNPPVDPKQDQQYEYWEYGVRKWVDEYKITHPSFNENQSLVVPTQVDDVHTPQNIPVVSIISPPSGVAINKNERVMVKLNAVVKFPVKKTELYVNNRYVLTAESDPTTLSFVPGDISNLTDLNNISVVLYDNAFNRGYASSTFQVLQ